MFVRSDTRNETQERFKESFNETVHDVFMNGSLKDAESILGEMNLFYEELNTGFYVKKDQLENEVLALKKDLANTTGTKIPEGKLDNSWSRTFRFILKAAEYGSMVIPNPFVGGGIGILSAIINKKLEENVEKNDVIKMKSDLLKLRKKIATKYKKKEKTLAKIDSLLARLDKLETDNLQ